MIEEIDQHSTNAITEKFSQQTLFISK